MKYTYFFLALSLLISPAYLFAQTETATNTETVASTTQDTTTPPQNPARRAALSDMAQTRLTNLAANVSNRMDAYVRRISNVNARLTSRADKMEAEGMDVTAARLKITEATAELQKAESTLASIDTIVANFVSSENPRTYWQTTKATYLTAREAIKAAHRATVETLLILKSATPKATNPAEATTTEATQ